MHLHTKKVMEMFDKAAPVSGKKGAAISDISARGWLSPRQYRQKRPGARRCDGKRRRSFSCRREWLGPNGSVIGVDISRQMLNELRKKAPSHVKLFQMDAENLDFPTHSFDVVLCACALYFFTDLAKGLSEFKRVLKPGGRLAVSTFCKNPQRCHPGRKTGRSKWAPAMI